MSPLKTLCGMWEKDKKVYRKETNNLAPTVTPTIPAAVAKSYTGNVTVSNVKVDISSSFGNKNGKIIADAI